MKKKKRVVATASAVALAAVLLFGGTMAYLYDESDEVTNTISPNYNSVTLKESDVDGDESETKNTYDIVPGTSDIKDPVATATYTLDSYVYIVMDETASALVDFSIDTSVWTPLEGYTNVWYTFVTEDNADSSASASGNENVMVHTKALNVLTDKTISYKSTLTNDDMTDDDGNPISDMTIEFQAYIVQASLGDYTVDDSGNKTYVNATAADAYPIAKGASYYVANAEEGTTLSYVYLADALSGGSTTLADALTTALSRAEEGVTTVVVLPSDDNDVSLTASALTNAVNETAVIDLNGGSLTVSDSKSVTLSEGDDLTIANGTVNTNLPEGATAAFVVNSNSTLTLENATMTTKGVALYARGDAAEVNVISSTISAYAYAVSTNAATADNYDVVINVEDSTLSAKGCAALINVPCTLNITNSTVTGDTQALIVRAGTANVKNTKLISTLIEDTYGSGIWSTYDNKNWGSGNAVAFAPLTIGNRNGSYSGDAVANLDGVTIEYNADEADAKGVYMYGGVTYPTTNESPNKAILNYNSETCSLGTIIQGETTYTEINDSVSSTTE